MSRFVTSAIAAVMLSALPLAGAVAQQPPPSQQPSPTGAPTAGQSNGIAIASDSLLGTTVKDQQGKDVGKVQKLMIDPNGGKVTSVIIAQGGTLGMGGKEISVPWEALKLQRAQDQRLVVTMQGQILEQAPPAASPSSGDKKQ
jgi:sporulation protein YlmC with PRC-barrel domain